MPRIIHRQLRFRVIDSCLRDVSRLYRISDIWKRCNELMQQTYGMSISKRSVQYDISILRQPPFSVELDERLLATGVYRYKNGARAKYPLLFTDEEANSSEMVCQMRFAPEVLPHIESMALSHGAAIEIIAPDWLRSRIGNIVSRMDQQYSDEGE